MVGTPEQRMGVWIASTVDMMLLEGIGVVFRSQVHIFILLFVGIFYYFFVYILGLAYHTGFLDESK